MDKRLEDRLTKWHQQIDVIKSQIASLQQKEKNYLFLDASEKALLGKLVSSAEGRSISEKEHQAYSSQEWSDFKKGLAESKSEYNFEKREYELSLKALSLKEKAYEAEYLTFKIENEAQKRG